MEIKEISVPLQGVVADYMKGRKEVQAFFDYPLTEDGFGRRLYDLRDKKFFRQDLVAHLLEYNTNLHAGDHTLRNIEALADENTYVVVGGQQAGLLTGPLYTVHKIISILQLAKEKEASLGVRVVPVFWIAGEDHDIDEINHVFVTKNKKIKKTIFHDRHPKKASASESDLSIADCRKWIEEIFKTYPETNFTKDVLQFVEDALQNSRTYVDFFAHLIMKLFVDSGLILVDSHHPALRKLEVSFFKQILSRYKEVQMSLQEQQQLVKEQGYKPIIETKSNAVHIFMQIDEERVLLEEENGKFVGKDGIYSFSYEELIAEMEKSPERFSNNVVTRPLMQEYIFPTLAFIGGPGEIAYWSELQQVFHVFGFQMPPVVPRLTISYMERDIITDLHDLQLQESDPFVNDIDMLRDEWLSNQIEEPIDNQFIEATEKMMDVHTSLQQFVKKIDPGLQQFAEKNEWKIKEQIELLERMLKRNVEKKHEVELNKFRRLQYALRPLGAPQERVWNICYYLNRFGLDFVERVMKQSYSWNGNHHIIKL
ncbi:bacillithiol biosynthesis cysteine-adding enzyme BshC [Bacillus pseudomycoides]|uniref:bacillithiol biosynthesis cysteine-adding enzyme BshC n=1 Tax=Bacillus pseudomycoides TaxID=64104 RepID=UPI000BEE67EC|nr:bacillithiol biosynthesis cysteine-adding enzyme BshC [Bacillus pseudomycoides]PEB40300.1 bacillithiol biosynthesis cysteine-adding enzyme BshC [Bacillus pseudomycoides]PGE02327.1 bacillithiol biosynthesis cysteine-adding enzyme BshC [Bacillus pseudomycoides]PGE03816.1 bacillithiol biosynthesis cysteine-adding enzyme BshC [Bacillus pseudomycoides]PHA95359.1 bacillithiol biosynthesis cysteine-adding enzyme BshC [Bacillus pseudomycoides]PHC77784.1 bacillithiol biosynthesis cysteine-adding enz